MSRLLGLTISSFPSATLLLGLLFSCHALCFALPRLTSELTIEINQLQHLDSNKEYSFTATRISDFISLQVESTSTANAVIEVSNKTLCSFLYQPVCLISSLPSKISVGEAFSFKSSEDVVILMLQGDFAQATVATILSAARYDVSIEKPFVTQGNSTFYGAVVLPVLTDGLQEITVSLIRDGVEAISETRQVEVSFLSSSGHLMEGTPFGADESNQVTLFLEGSELFEKGYNVVKGTLLNDSMHFSRFQSKEEGVGQAIQLRVKHKYTSIKSQAMLIVVKYSAFTRTKRSVLAGEMVFSSIDRRQNAVGKEKQMNFVKPFKKQEGREALVGWTARVNVEYFPGSELSVSALLLEGEAEARQNVVKANINKQNQPPRKYFEIDLSNLSTTLENPFAVVFKDVQQDKKEEEEEEAEEEGSQVTNVLWRVDIFRRSDQEDVVDSTGIRIALIGGSLLLTLALIGAAIYKFWWIPRQWEEKKYEEEIDEEVEKQQQNDVGKAVELTEQQGKRNCNQVEEDGMDLDLYQTNKPNEVVASDQQRMLTGSQQQATYELQNGERALNNNDISQRQPISCGVSMNEISNYNLRGNGQTKRENFVESRFMRSSRQQYSSNHVNGGGQKYRKQHLMIEIEDSNTDPPLQKLQSVEQQKGQ